MGTFLSLFQKGGPVMYPLLLCSVIGLAICIEKLYNLNRARVDPAKLMDRIKGDMRKGDFRSAIGYCEATPGPVAGVLATAIELRELPGDELKEGVSEAVLTEVPRLERFLSTLSTIVTLSPLLGLLGTIAGLMRLFNVIAEGSIGNSAALSSGIAVALITTATGLIIAIPFLALHNYLAGRVDALVNDMDRAVAEFLNFYRMEVRDVPDGAKEG
ncbi:MAG: MotA/TolQ/ExbB proton channel family protein [bacterium]